MDNSKALAGADQLWSKILEHVLMEWRGPLACVILLGVKLSLFSDAGNN
jgi:hypothetical protein